MSEKLRILVTGFGPFPGAPYNPTQPLVARLTRLRRPALSDVELSSHIFPVTYKAVDRELPLARGGATRRKGFPRITQEELVDAGEAMLLEMVRLARRAS